MTKGRLTACALALGLLLAGCGVEPSSPASHAHGWHKTAASGPGACLRAGAMASSSATGASQTLRVHWIVSGPSLVCTVQVERAERGQWTLLRTVRTKQPVEFARLALWGRLDGWLMVTTGPGYPAASSVYRTTDGGSRWTEVLTTAAWREGTWAKNGSFGLEMSFASANDGWILASGLPGAGSAPKELLATRDGGRTWNVAADSVALGGAIGSDQATLLDFTTPRTGWIAASTDAASSVPEALLYATKDGGKAWTPAALPKAPLTAGLLTAFRAVQLRFATPSHGLLVYRFVSEGGSAATFCYRTRDGGSAWTVAACPR